MSSLFITYLSFVADVPDRDTSQLAKRDTFMSTRETNDELTNDRVLVSVTHHAHTGSRDPRFGVVILVHEQLSTGVADNQLVQLQQQRQTDRQTEIY